MKALIGMMEVCMSNHMYTIGGDIRIQGDGGSIGSDLTGEVTRIYMIQWEEELKKRCKKAGVSLELYKRYVDDMFLAMRPIARGWRFNSQSGRLEFNKEVSDTCNQTPTQRTSRVMADIANSIDPHIQVTVDSP